MESETAVEFIAEWPPTNKRVRYDAGLVVTAHAQEGAQADLEGGRMLSSKEVLLAECDPSLMANTLLAKWWKLMKGSASDAIAHVAKVSSNPNTLLHCIASLPQAQRFLKCRYNFLQREATRCPRPGVYLALSSCCQKLGCYREGVEYCQLALRGLLKDSQTSLKVLSHEEMMVISTGSAKVLSQRKVCSKGMSTVLSHEEREVGSQEGESPEMKEAQWLLHVLLRQTHMEKRRQCMEEKGFVQRGFDVRMPTPVEVERRCFDGFSCEEFYTRYACTHTPVIITGVVEHITSVPWTFDHITKVIGEKITPLKRMVPSSVEWAKLEPAGVCTVREFIDSLDTVAKADMKYLFDWSLPLHCPDLMKELTLPLYFADNMLQQTPPGTLYRDSWPSLFIAPKGLYSELHVDAFGSNFWMALFEGRKRWLLFPPEDTPCLYPVYAHTTDATFQVNLAAPDLALHPLLSLTHPWECVLQPGELLFVPSGCPHRVENMEKSLAISANFVDRSNLAKVLEELKVNSILDERSADLLEILQSMSCDSNTGIGD